MTNTNKTEVHKLALAIDPTPRGFGYALFEGPGTPLDWGTTEIRTDQNQKSLERIKKLIKFYHPEVLVLEDCSNGQGRRCERVKTLIDQIAEFSQSQNIPTVKYAADRIKDVFSIVGLRNKHQIAQEICARLPELAPRIPPKRKPWMSEDRRMGIFDAVALVLIYYYLEE